MSETTGRETAEDAVSAPAVPERTVSAALRVEWISHAGTEALAPGPARWTVSAVAETVTPRRASRDRKRSRARESRPLTVPTGQPSAAAAWSWVSPSR